MNNYEEKRQFKINHALLLAHKAQKESERTFNTAQQIGSYIPFGQPILVGHHSEGRHRRDLNRIDSNMRQSIEADKKAKYYAGKAHSMENNYAISSDDPEAVTKLKEKLAGLEKTQELMKACNKIIKSNKPNEVKIAEMIVTGLPEKYATEILKPDFFNHIGFPSYKLTNNNQNMNTVRKRIDELCKRATLVTTENEINGVKIIDNIEENRLQAFFNGKPSEEIRDRLKHSGFRWSPFNGCWQSYRNQHSKDALESICSSL
jgi:hypothetical protein